MNQTQAQLSPILKNYNMKSNKNVIQRKISDRPETIAQTKSPPDLEAGIASDMSKVTSPAKRRLLSSLGAGGGVLGVSALVPATWVKPVVDSVILPTHAQTSPTEPPSTEPPSTEPEPEPEPEPPSTGPTQGAVTDFSLTHSGQQLIAGWTAFSGDAPRIYIVRYGPSTDFASFDPVTVVPPATFDEAEGFPALEQGEAYHAQITSHYTNPDNPNGPDVTFTAATLFIFF